MPTNENFELVEVQIPEPRDRQFLVRNISMSVDPYMRGRMTEVLESKNNQFAVGDYVVGMNRCIGYQKVNWLVVLARSIQI